MKAIKTVSEHRAEIQDVPVPTLRDGYVLVKVAAVALNPTDWKHIDVVAPPGTTVGCDFAGVIEEIGTKAGDDWRKGDRVAGFVHGANAVQPEDGCFAEYCVVKAGLGVKIPSHITDEAACTLGVGVTTVGQALYQSLGLPLPNRSGALPTPTRSGPPLLIYGGSTATGSLAIQYARLSGCTPILTTSSSHHFAWLRSLGADATFDYKDPDCLRQIREYTNGALKHAFDCISTKESAELCSEAMGPTGGAVSYLLPVRHKREDVQVRYTLAYTSIGEPFSLPGGRDFEARAEDLEFAKMFWDLTEHLLEGGLIQVHPPQVGKDGLHGINGGLQMMREGRVSGKKLVYRIAD